MANGWEVDGSVVASAMHDDASGMHGAGSDLLVQLDELDRDASHLVYCRSDNRSGQAVAVMNEMGFTTVCGHGRGIVAWSGGEVVTGMHVGSYDTLGETYVELTESAAAEGLALADHMWEFSLSDPEEELNPATWQTMVRWPPADGQSSTGLDDDVAVRRRQLDAAR